MSRKVSKVQIFVCLVMPLLLASTSPVAAQPSGGNPHTWLVHIIRFPNGTTTGLWPESADSDNVAQSSPHALPHLHARNKDKIKFQLDVNEPPCRLVFAISPFALESDKDEPVDTIDVFYPPTGGQPKTYVICSKTQIPTGGYCEYFFRVLNNPDCNRAYNICGFGTPPPGPSDPCWMKSIRQIGPGMDISD